MGKCYTCEIGQKFGNWTIIDNIPEIRNTHRYVKAKCECGKEEMKCLSDLYTGKTTKCRSCAAREKSRKVKIGDKFKHWTIIDGPKSNEHQCLVWLVQCDCGQSQKWAQANEIMDPNRNFECNKCAQKHRGERETIENGRVGELTKTRYTKLKISAAKRNINFSVSLEYLWNLYIKQNKKCAITGDDLPNLKEASLDRINSNLGYIEDNVQWVTKQANLSKHIMSMQQLYEFCEKVLKHANQQPSMSLTTHKGSETNS